MPRKPSPRAIIIAVILVTAFAAHGALYTYWFGWKNLFIESSWVEIWQLLAWLTAASFSWWGVARIESSRDRAMALWLAILSSLCAAREEDRHELLNPEVIGDFGVRFRVDWWLDASVPLLLKLAWLIVAIVLIAGVTLPLLWARPRVLRLIFGRDPAIWLCGVGGGFMMLGYLFDDIIGRGLLVSLNTSQVLEEGSETIGAFLIAAGVFVSLRSRLDEREAAADRRLGRADCP
jgi:hypothetical protein